MYLGRYGEVMNSSESTVVHTRLLLLAILVLLGVAYLIINNWSTEYTN